MYEFFNLNFLYKEVLKQKLLFFTINFFILLIFFFLAVNQPNIYSSQVIAVPKSSQNGSNSFPNELTGFANIAGINISKEEVSKVDEGTSYMRSLDFFKLLQTYIDMKPNLLAAKSWDKISGKIIYDEKLFISEKNEWVRSFSYPKKKIPSDQEAHKKFLDHFKLVVDKNTGLMILNIEHLSPFVAQEWLSIIIKAINSKYRNDQKIKTTQSIDFLTTQLKTTNLLEVREALSRLIENETKNLMLVESEKEYFLKVLQSPIVPEEKIRPKRSQVMLLGAMISILFSLMAVILRASILKK